MSDLSPAAFPVPACPPLFSPRRQRDFCEALSQHGNVRVACRAAGVSPQTAYRAKRGSEDFRACWDAALLLARDHAEAVLADRALNGVEEAVFYHGEEVATRRRYDTRLLLAHLARLDRMAEKMEESGAGSPHGGGFDEALDALAHGAPVAGPGGALSPRREVQDKDDGEVIPAFERRLHAMEAARPFDAPPLSALGDAGEVEAVQLLAFEAGEEEWWLVTPDEEDLRAMRMANF
ncbi:hypothetical protein FHS61_001719 [Altererythrobacter atlanticus]|uniref:Uncharacterized protein n=1 Tax=Croceibacterium atlanticum TaxID=1267766 RepID=A0A0F7KKU7_9SPHN|nr:hypothetical protein [Croceibacterium atlanticum]AKH41193.1 hypothetical protein WYH_00127 [Croceibacterium atlanticum]MBB5732710.1 hypothetical protein [Croceibacterium atlanticum]